MARSDPTAWLVQVLEGPLAGQNIELIGRSAPYRSNNGGSISFGVQQRSKLIYYQGNKNATQMVFGPTIDPTTINGIWKERYLGEDGPINLVETFEALANTGVQVLVTWETLRYQGIVKKISHKPGMPTGGLTDIGWEITFEWNSRGTASRRRVLDTQVPLREGIAGSANDLASLNDQIGSLVDTIDSFVGTLNRGLLGTTNDFADLIEQLKPATDTLSNAASAVGSVEQLSGRLLEDASSAVSSGQDIAAQVAEVTAGIFPGAISPDDSVATLLDDALDRANLTDECYRVIDALFEQQLRLEEIIRPDQFVELNVVQGTDLRQLSNRFFGTPDNWQRIAKANGITSGSLVPSDLVRIIIPLQASTALDDSVVGH